MKSWRGLVLLLLLLPLLSCGGSEPTVAVTVPPTIPPAPTATPLPPPTATPEGMPGWVEFSSDAGRFSIALPEMPEEGTIPVETDVGMVNLYTYFVESGDIAFMVGYVDYPAELIESADPDAMLDGAAAGAVSNVQGELIDQQTISLDGYPGRSVIMDVGGDQGRAEARLYMVESRLYQIIVIGFDAGALDERADYFLESFRLTGE